ncbi:MAG TPA: hypothetical protein PKE29_11445 [Phycisphaerales bacterium]|nr:hypothetical protein [Phycisphaerales bacterium]
MSTRAPSRSTPIDIDAGGNGPTDVVVNGVFLSPRVIDRRAYNELAGELRDLVEKSAAERSTLVAALDEAGRASQEFRQREGTQNSNIELAARALRAMDERMSRVETLLARAEAQGKIFEQLEGRAGGMIQSKVQVLEARLEAVQSAATAKTEALEERIRRASRELEQRIEAIRRDADSIAGPAQEALSGLCQRAGAILGREAGTSAPASEGSLGDIVERAELLAGEVMRVSKTLEDGSERLEQSRRQAAELTVRQQEIEGRTEELRSNVERNLEVVRSRLMQQQLELVSRTQTVVDGAQESVRRLEAQAAEASEAGARAFADLRSSIQQSIDAHNTTTLAIKILNTSIDQAKVLSAQLEPWRGLLDSSGTGQMPLAIRRMIEGVRGELTTELSSIAGALRSAAEKAERAGRSMDAASRAPTGGPLTTAIPSGMSIGPAAALSNPLVGARVSRPAIGMTPGKDIPTATRPMRAVDAAD